MLHGYSAFWQPEISSYGLDFAQVNSRPLTKVLMQLRRVRKWLGAISGPTSQKWWERRWYLPSWMDLQAIMPDACQPGNQWLNSCIKWVRLLSTSASPYTVQSFQQGNLSRGVQQNWECIRAGLLPLLRLWGGGSIACVRTVLWETGWWSKLHTCFYCTSVSRYFSLQGRTFPGNKLNNFSLEEDMLVSFLMYCTGIA